MKGLRIVVIPLRDCNLEMEVSIIVLRIEQLLLDMVGGLISVLRLRNAFGVSNSRTLIASQRTQPP